MTKRKILETLKRMHWIGKHWKIKNFTIVDNKNYIIFLFEYNNKLMQHICYCKNNGYTQVYDFDEVEQHLLVDLYL